jgi:hypothetical protein
MSPVFLADKQHEARSDILSKSEEISFLVKVYLRKGTWGGHVNKYFYFCSKKYVKFKFLF